MISDRLDNYRGFSYHTAAKTTPIPDGHVILGADICHLYYDCRCSRK